MDILAQRFDCVKGGVELWNCGIWITKGTKAREKHESAFVFEQVVKVAWHGRVAALGGHVYLVRGRGYDLEPDGPEFWVVGRGWPAFGLGLGRHGAANYGHRAFVRKSGTAGVNPAGCARPGPPG